MISASLLLAAALTRSVVDHGIAVELNVSDALRDGDSMQIALTLRDETTRAPLTGVRPLAWLAPRDTTGTRECLSEAARFLGSSLTDRPVADFNDFYVLAMNEQPSISVVDPRFRFGRSQLLSLILLEAPGDDWVLTPDSRKLFVTLPTVGKVAVVDTTTWTVRTNVDVGAHPTRIALQPDGARVWVITDDGLAVLDVRRVAGGRPRADARDDTDPLVRRVALPPSLALAAPASVSSRASARDPLATEHNPHDLTFSSDSRYAITNGAIIDTATFATHAIAAGVIAYSTAANLVYSGNTTTGVIRAINPATRKTLATFNAEAGFTQIRFTPNARYGFIANPIKNLVQIFDSATNKIIQTADIADGPDQITFTDRIAFIRRRDSDTVSMITLQNIRAGARVGVAEFPGGQSKLGAGDLAASAASIVEAPDGPAVLVANPADKSIYYYKEGMAAPMGAFGNYSRQPRAVLVVDRSLREQTPGVYTSRAQIADPGQYELVVFLDSPRVSGCFPIEVGARPETREKLARAVFVEPLAVSESHAGKATRIHFRIAERESRQTRNAGDVEIVVMEAPGVWQRRTIAKPSTDGTYAIEITPPTAGIYYVWVASATSDLPINNAQFITFEVD
jgi:YVTN family beta-propeller protein